MFDYVGFFVRIVFKKIARSVLCTIAAFAKTGLAGIAWPFEKVARFILGPKFNFQIFFRPAVY